MPEPDSGKQPAPPQAPEKRGPGVAETVAGAFGPVPSFPLAQQKGLCVEAIALDTYDDIFSDFDYGPLETRRLSGDLVDEIEGRLRGPVCGRAELAFSVPAALRDARVEEMVAKRLKRFFADRLASARAEISRRRRAGALRLAAGSLLLGLEAVLLALAGSFVAVAALSSIAAPAAWYLSFTGLEFLVDVPKDMLKKRDIYSSLKGAKISFRKAEAASPTQQI
ncbi:MAG: hypothetical protein PHF51_01130 [Candidatus ainarchaeum sp.]|nr:hypothetical protein [Candidatus ainarchaeum sp.]